MPNYRVEFDVRHLAPRWAYLPDATLECVQLDAPTAAEAIYRAAHSSGIARDCLALVSVLEIPLDGIPVLTDRIDPVREAFKAIRQTVGLDR